MDAALEPLREAHAQGLFRPKAPKTAWVKVPAALAMLDSGPVSCDSDCEACWLRPQTSSSDARELDRRHFKTLAYGDGLPLKALLALLRFARPYSQVPSDAPWTRSLFNATDSLLMDELANRCMSTERYLEMGDPRDSAQRAVGVLREFGLLLVVEDPGQKSFYAPHKLTGHVRIPQHLWRDGWLQRLNGTSLQLLLHLLALAHNGRGRVNFVQPYNVVEQLPVKKIKRDAAVNQLESDSLIMRLETRGEKYLALLERR